MSKQIGLKSRITSVHSINYSRVPKRAWIKERLSDELEFNRKLLNQKHFRAGTKTERAVSGTS